MKKKLLYGIFFISIFLLSTASMVQPVQGYEFGVPDAAIGRDVEAEITIYDEDEWEDHLGKDSDLGDQGYEGDWDEVGATTKSHYTEIEEKYDDEGIKYLKDHSWKRTIRPGNENARNAVNGLFNPAFTSSVGTAMLNMNSTAAYTLAYGGLGGADLGAMNAYYTAVDTTTETVQAYNGGEGLTNVENAPGFNKRFDGMYLHRDWWYFEKDEYDEDPDDEDYEIPFLADPRDFVTAWGYTRDLGYIQVNDINNMMGLWSGAVPVIYNLNDKNAYTAWNDSINTLMPSTLKGTLKTLGYNMNPNYNQIENNVTDYVWGFYMLSNYVMSETKASIQYGYVSKTGYLMSVLLANQPMYVPQADFIAKLVDAFDLNDEANVKLPALISQAYTVGTTTIRIPVYAQVDVYTEGVAIIMEVEYQDGQIDPADSLLLPDGEGEDELEDFEIVIVYSDTGGPSSIEFKDGDDIFWK
jgi:hypothetical protein